MSTLFEKQKGPTRHRPSTSELRLHQMHRAFPLLSEFRSAVSIPNVEIISKKTSVPSTKPKPRDGSQSARTPAEQPSYSPPVPHPTVQTRALIEESQKAFQSIISIPKYIPMPRKTDPLKPKNTPPQQPVSAPAAEEKATFRLINPHDGPKLVDRYRDDPSRLFAACPYGIEDELTKEEERQKRAKMGQKKAFVAGSAFQAKEAIASSKYMYAPDEDYKRTEREWLRKRTQENKRRFQLSLREAQMSQRKYTWRPFVSSPTPSSHADEHEDDRDTYIHEVSRQDPEAAEMLDRLMHAASDRGMSPFYPSARWLSTMGGGAGEEEKKSSNSSSSARKKTR